MTLTFNSRTGYGHDPYTCKNEGQRSVCSKTCKQTDGHDRLQYIRSNTITCISFGVIHKPSDYLSDLETLRIQKCLRPITWWLHLQDMFLQENRIARGGVKFDNMPRHFDAVHIWVWQTDGQTYRQYHNSICRAVSTICCAIRTRDCASAYWNS